MSSAPSDASGGVPFSFFSCLCRNIATLKPVPAKKSKQVGGEKPMAAGVFKSWVEQLNERYGTVPKGTTALLFRLLFPEEDRRRVYNMQEKGLAAALEDVYVFKRNSLQSWTSSGCLGLWLKKSLQPRFTNSDQGISPLSICRVAGLLDELASHSSFTHNTIRTRFPPEVRRTRQQILHSLFYTLPPLDASILVQIILKDLRPVLYPPPPDVHYSVALRNYNTESVHALTRYEAMRIWDPSRVMARSSQVTAVLEDLSEAFETGRVLKPRIGCPIEIPKSLKGQSCEKALKHFTQTNNRVWAEVKYDGERAQIHVQIKSNGKPHITIFSKSKRDSTNDRFGVHHIIRSALSLNDPEEGGIVSKFKHNVILDAEMVPFQDEHIIEFWHLRALIEETAHGVRAGQRKHKEELENVDSQNSLVSEVNEGQHLGLVFFDVLFLDGRSQLARPYCERREILESIVSIIPGQAILAERHLIDLKSTHELPEVCLARTFARCLAYHQEGLVLKSNSGNYGEDRNPWVKLKKDYIPGLGDCLDMILVGASWEKDRGHQLKVTSDTLTTLYIGTIKNKEAVSNHPDTIPHVHIYFTVSFGLDRAELEDLNFLLKNSESIPYCDRARKMGSLEYTFDKFRRISDPEFLLCTPLLAEVMGAGFDKAKGSMHYELRFPRITKVHRRGDRSWTESVGANELHDIALQVIGRDPRDKALEDWNDTIWGLPSTPSVLCPKKREEDATVWFQKLLEADKPRKRRAGGASDSTRSPAKRRKVAPPIVPEPLQRLRSMTNVYDASSSKGNHRSQSDSQKSISRAPYPLSPPGSSPLRPTHRSHTDSLSRFLCNAVVWFSPKSAGGSPISTWEESIPTQSRLNSFSDLLTQCGWGPDCPAGLKSGLVLLDSRDTNFETWQTQVFNSIRRSPGQFRVPEKRRPIFVLDTKTFDPTLDVSSQAIYTY